MRGRAVNRWNEVGTITSLNVRSINDSCRRHANKSLV